MHISPEIYFKTVFEWLCLAEHFASLKNGVFLNTDIFTQGSVATLLGCGGVFVYDFVTNFLLSLTVKAF